MKKFLVILPTLLLIGIAIYILYPRLLGKNPNVPRIPQVGQNNSTQPTSEHEEIETVVENLEVPWSIAFFSNGDMIVTERPGRVQLISNGAISQLIEIDDVKQTGESGLHGVAIDPDFDSNKFIYLYYTYSSNGNNTLNKVVRYTLENNSLVENKIIIDEIPGAIFHDGGRIAFGPDGYLYITTGDAREPSLAQDRNSLAGKILRLTRDGQVPSDNPFSNAVYSYGHRNPQGIAWDNTGQLWATEHGPSGSWPDCCQDEVNRVEKGGNYGWPDSVGNTVASGTIGPILQSEEDIWAPGGIAFLDGRFYFTGLRGSAIYSFDPKNPTGTFKTLFDNEYGRIRDAVAHEGGLYISTSNRDGRGNPRAQDDKVIRIDARYFQK